MTKQPMKKLIQITIKKVIKRIKMLYEKWKDFDHQKKRKRRSYNVSFNTSNCYGLPKVQQSKIIQDAKKKQRKIIPVLMN